MTSHTPRKRFGQHFLHDKHIIQDIITAFAPKEEEHIVEIGPGKGALTLPLLEYKCQFDIIELDRDLIGIFEKKANDHFRIHQADILKFDVNSLLLNDEKLRIIGNLPYNISTPLLFYLVLYADKIQDMTFMLQKEVVDRMVALPSTSNYGRLSVMLQYFCQIKKLFDVSANAFTPPPKVESSIVQLIPHRTPPVTVLNQKNFSKIVALAFSQRRKMLRNTLKTVFSSKAIEAVGVNPQARAETLTLEDFARLANSLDSILG